MNSKKRITLTSIALSLALIGCEQTRHEKVESLTETPDPAPLAPPRDVPLAENPTPITPTPHPRVETKREMGEPAAAQTDVQRARTEALRARFANVTEKWETIEAREDSSKAAYATERVEETLESARSDLESLQRADGTVWTDLEVSFEAKLDDLEARIQKAERAMHDG